MKVRFLGTGTSQGVPIITCDCKVCSSSDTRDKRLRSSILIQTNGLNIVIDAGPDFRYQMLKAKIKRLDGIILTHEHKDHIGGLDDIRPFNYLQKKAIDIYAEKRVAENIKTRDFAYVFAQKRYPGIPKMNLIEISEKAFRLKSAVLTPIRGFHHKLPVLGFRIKNFAYLTDMNRLKSGEMKKLSGLDTLVVTALRKEKHISHFNLPESLDLINKLKPKRAFLTHMGHQIGLHKDLEAELPEHISPAYDDLIIEI